jgi:putative PEP-CTERM system TPR-repeat lipoprotein
LRKIILIVFLIIGLTGCNKDLSAQQLFENGMMFLESGNTNGAILAFKEAITKDMNYYEARYQLSRAYISQEKYSSARSELEKVLRLNPSFHDVHISIAKIFISSGKTDDAIKEIDVYWSKSSDENPEAYEIGALAYANKRDYAKAEDLLNKAIEKSPKRVSAKIILANVHRVNGETSEAEKIIEEVLKLDSGNKKALYFQASLKMEQNKAEDAFHIYEKIAQIDPKDVTARYQLGLHYLRINQIEKAKKIAAELSKSFVRRPEGYYLMGIVNYHERKIDDAIISLQNSVKKGPNPGAFYYLGLCHIQKRNFEQATSAFQKTLDMRPDLMQARLLLAEAHLRSGRTEQAEKEILMVLDRDDKNALAHNFLGSIYLAQGKGELAMEELDRALELNPKMANIHLKKGAFQLLSGDSKKAEEEFIDAVEISPDVLQSRVVLARYYVLNLDYDNAIKILKEGLKDKPNDAILLNLMGMAYLGKKDAASAVRHFEKAVEANPRFFLPYINLAAYYAVKGENDKAIKEYQKILAIDGNNTRAMLMLAGHMERIGKDKEALTYYVKAKEQKTAAAFLALANYYTRKKDIKNAVTVIDELLNIEPKNIKAMIMKGQLYFANKDYQKALATYRQLESISPENGEIRMAGVYKAMGDYDRALEKLKTLLSRHPGRADMHAELMRLYLKKKDDGKAEETAQKIVALKPESDTGHLLVAAVYIEENRFQNAINELKEAEQLNPDNINTKVTLGRTYISLKDYGKALEVSDELEKYESISASAYFFQASILEITGKKESAVKKHKKVLDLSPDFILSLNNLAYLYAEGYGPIDQAIVMAQKAKKLSPESGSITDTLGWVLYKKGSYDDAVKYFNEAIQYLPDNPSIQYHLGLAYLKKGMRVKAGEHLKNAVRLGSKGSFPAIDDARKILKEI